MKNNGVKCIDCKNYVNDTGICDIRNVSMQNIKDSDFTPCDGYIPRPQQEPARTFAGHPGGELEMKDEPKQYGHPRFYEMLKTMADLHSRKNHDYAGTSDPLKNLRACKRLELDPFMGVMVRLQDKWSRLEEFVKSGKLMVKSESVKDTLMDNAVYSILAIILYEEQEKDRTTPVEGGY